ncbi:MAG TPA: glycoside hydrolase family 25 protein [Stellaceae bacterium]|nr:glycoside hydrolase family 25 protein [Stellaceae bacterium]
MSLPSPVLDGIIDVSHYNGDIDWNAVAGAGIALAFIKASEGARFVDPRFAENRAAAEAVGILAVPYHFVDAGAAADQARHFIAAAGLAAGMPAMLDWETVASVAGLVMIGAAVSEATGRDPVGYYGWAQLRAANLALSRWPLFLPEYPRGEAPGDYASLVIRAPRLPPGRDAARPYDFHQYTPAGAVPGIAGPVDRSVWVGTRDALRLWHRSGTRPAG